jgi:hypothetical protein
VDMAAAAVNAASTLFFKVVVISFLLKILGFEASFFLGSR